ncbi:MAG: NADPH-dependent reductase [Firmicutes bacterium]|nr:NADPH-dependent reductase [Bacillota bacterium]
MRVLAINGSPRKNGNTAILLHKALEGAATKGAATEFIHLYDLNYKGCVSCFACKLKDGKSYGKCSYKDELTPVLEKVEQADAIILGSPIYLGTASGEMRSFLERLIFQYLVYDGNYSSLFKKKIRTAFIYTMNVSYAQMIDMGYERHLRLIEIALERTFGSTVSLFVTDTCQFEDYSKYVVTAFDPEKKAKRRQEVFPKDCEKAFNIGARFVTKSVCEPGAE